MNKLVFKTKIRRLKYKIKSDFLTFDKMVIALAAVVSLSWAWGSIVAMEKNYSLQQELILKRRDKLVMELKYETLKYEQKYLQSEEYQELAAREKLGLAAEGESVLLLDDYPALVEEVKKSDKNESNFSQWMNFLFGGNAKRSTKY